MGVERHSAFDEHPALRTIGAVNAMLVLKDALARRVQAGFAHRLEVRPVFRMDEVHYPARWRTAGWQAKDAFEL